MSELFQQAHSTQKEAAEVAKELMAQIGQAPSAVTLFFSRHHDGLAISTHLRRAWPKTKVIGCSTMGEISTGRITDGGVSAAALRPGLIGRCATVLAQFDRGVEQGVKVATAQLEEALGSKLRELDPNRYVGIVVSDSLHGEEDALHEALGNAAPMLSFLGGSAGDEGRYESTRCLVDGAMTTHGAALMVMEVLRPFHLMKLCHYEPTEKSFTVTKIEGHAMFEINGRPAAEVYSEMLGVPVKELGMPMLALNPTGMMIDGEPWIRQSVSPPREDGAMLLIGTVPQGSHLHFMRPKAGVLEHSKSSLASVSQKLGGKIQGALVFDCPGRRMAAEAMGSKDAYQGVFNFPVAGFITHGEHYLGFVQQTLTGIVFG